MSRTRKRYANGKLRQNQSGERRSAIKDYHRVEIGFHGSESSYQKWAEKKARY